MTKNEIASIPDDLVLQHLEKSESLNKISGKLAELFEDRQAGGEIVHDIIGAPLLRFYLKNQRENDYIIVKNSGITGEIVLVNSKFSKKETDDIITEVFETLSKYSIGIENITSITFFPERQIFSVDVKLGSRNIILRTLSKNTNIPIRYFEISEAAYKVTPLIKKLSTSDINDSDVLDAHLKAAQFRMYGGDRIIVSPSATPAAGQANICTAGFNVYTGIFPFLITAGHCHGAYGLNGLVYDNSTAARFPLSLYGGPSGVKFSNDGDYSITGNSNFMHTSGPQYLSAYGGVSNVRGATTVAAGAPICKFGTLSDWTCGTVTAASSTFPYQNIVIRNVIKAGICAEPGDSGGPVVTTQSQLAVGIISGGDSALPCNTFVIGGTQRNTWIMPINTILNAYNVKLFTGP